MTQAVLEGASLIVVLYYSTCCFSLFCLLLISLDIKLDDALFQRLVESRWDDEQKSTGRNAIDCESFVRLYSTIWTPATSFGRHLRKAAGRGDEELGEDQTG